MNNIKDNYAVSLLCPKCLSFNGNTAYHQLIYAETKQTCNDCNANLIAIDIGILQSVASLIKLGYNTSISCSGNHINHYTNDTIVSDGFPYIVIEEDANNYKHLTEIFDVFTTRYLNNNIQISVRRFNNFGIDKIQTWITGDFTVPKSKKVNDFNLAIDRLVALIKNYRQKEI